jgi:hypothetical protein
MPRRCGIGVFTTDLANALEVELRGQGEIYAVAMDDVPEGYRYPDRVRFQIRASNQPDYHMAADFISGSQANRAGPAQYGSRTRRCPRPALREPDPHPDHAAHGPVLS